MTNEIYKNPLIVSVELQNFMCHRNFKIDFNKPITCIGGSNGSGKSAVMIALGLVFGQRTQSMERGSSYTELVRTQSGWASIKIILNNYKNVEIEDIKKPNFPYKKGKMTEHDNYIEIYKKIYRSNGSSSKSQLKIRRGDEKYVPLTKSGLDHLMEQYSLSFQNPLNFLTQEGSKKILNVKRPAELYEIFYRGSEFERLEIEIEEGKQRIGEIRRRFDEYEGRNKCIKDTIVKLTRNLKILGIDNTKHLGELEREERLCDVREKLDEISDLDVELGSIAVEKAKINEWQRSLVYENRDTKTECIDMNEVKGRLDEKMKEVKMIEMDFEGIEEKCKEIERSWKEIEGRKTVEDLQNELAEIKGKRTMHEKEVQGFQIEEIRREVLKENKENERKMKEKERLKKMMRENLVSPRYERMEREMDKILERIRRSRFDKSVIGPVYRYVNLTAEKWYQAVSYAIYRTLNNFIVLCKKDREILTEIFKELNVNYPILFMESEVSYENLKIPRHRTILSVLNISHPCALKALVTYHSIEQTVLAESREEAYEMVEKSESIDNIDSVFLVTGDKIKKMKEGLLNESRERRLDFFYFESREKRNEELKREIEKLEVSTVWRDEERRWKMKEREIEEEICRMMEEEKRVEAEIGTFRYISDSEEATAEKKLERKMKVAHRQLETLKLKKEKAEEELRILSEEKKKAERENRRLVEETLRKERQKEEEKIKAEVKNKLAEEKHRKLMLKRKDQLERLRELFTSISMEAEGGNDDKLFVKNLTELCASIRPRKVIGDEKIEVKRRILNAQRLGDKVALEAEFDRQLREKDRIDALLNKFTGIVGHTEKSIEQRRAKRTFLLDQVSREIVEEYNRLTTSNGYDGVLSIDHNLRTISVSMRVHGQSVCGNKFTLSGGERSFAGVCFLLSLWKCFTCPVKIIDEFDVFMDPLNREASIRALFGFVKNQLASSCPIQVILITPLDLHSVFAEEDALCEVSKIYKKE